MTISQSYRNFLVSDNYSLFKLLINDLKKDVMDKMVACKDKEELFLLQREYKTLDNLEVIFKEKSQIQKGDD